MPPELLHSDLLAISSLDGDLLLRVLASNNAVAHMPAHNECAPDELVEVPFAHILLQRLTPEYRSVINVAGRSRSCFMPLPIEPGPAAKGQTESEMRY